MFEKEAEERVKHLCLSRPNAYVPVTSVEYWKDGAEFGYNKAKVEVEESYRESLCNSELNLASVTEQLEELEKANEWHYVKDGDLPKDYGYYLVALKSVAYKGFVFEVVYFTGCIFTKEGEISDNVYAWKEIVLPKESE